MKIIEIEATIEALLFAAGEAVSLSELALVSGHDFKTTKAIIRGLMDKLEKERRGICIIEMNESFQMCTNPIYYDYISIMFSNPQKKQITQPLLETLAIIAYRQPVTKGQIEEIRGVDAGHAVNKLLEYGLVCEKGRLDAPGRPILFGTTNDFLKHFGFSGLDKLPELPMVTEEDVQIEIKEI